MEEEHRNPLIRFWTRVFMLVDGPVTWFRETIVEPNQKHYPYYHQKFRRVPTLDECYMDDYVCKWEADQQMMRDKMVDSHILRILRERYEHCVLEDENQRREKKCTDLWNIYEDAAGDWFCKWGDLGPFPDAKNAFMKQKHRLIWERRHGPVGSGMKTDKF